MSRRPQSRSHLPQQSRGLDITVRTGSGAGATTLSAFDRALQRAGVADFNLVTLSSVIPTGSRVSTVDAPLAGGHGDLLFCVRAQSFAEEIGQETWAGLGWCSDDTGGGLFVEHRGETRESVEQQIEASLRDMTADRGDRFGAVQMALASARCTGDPVCALVIAAYRVSAWHDTDADTDSDTDTDTGAERVVETSVRRRDDAGPPVAAVEGPDASVSVSVVERLDDETAVSLFALYREAFDPLGSAAAARQVLYEAEFVAEMKDPRVAKYVARDRHGAVVGLSTLTADLSSVPWISPSYFAQQFPSQYARGAVYYMGFTLVRPSHRGMRTYHEMFKPMVAKMVAENAVAAWDICAVNDARGLGGDGARLLQSLADVSITAVDRQTYYAGEFRGPAISATPA